MFDDLTTFPHAHGRRVLMVVVIGAATAPRQSIPTHERTT